jgi:hypothetical protein
MKPVLAVLTASAIQLSAGIASAQTPTNQPTAPVVGTAALGVTVTQLEAVVVGWSAKKDLIGKTVMSDTKDKIGKIADLIISPGSDSKGPFASFAIIGVGGFLGVGVKDVAIPMEQIKIESGKLVLAGATKDALKSMPKFEYRRK